MVAVAFRRHAAEAHKLREAAGQARGSLFFFRKQKGLLQLARRLLIAQLPHCGWSTARAWRGR